MAEDRRRGVFDNNERSQGQEKREELKLSSTTNSVKRRSHKSQAGSEEFLDDSLATVTYNYIQSPVTFSTRTLSELSSVLPSDGPTLESQNLLGKYPLPSGSFCSVTPTNSPLHKKIRKRLKTDPDIQRIEVQSLFKIASELCSSSSTNDNAEQTTKDQSHRISPGKEGVESDIANSRVLRYDEDEIFWSQAAEIVEHEGWDKTEDNIEDRDSAFIDELISSGLVTTPQIGITTSTINLSPSPHSNSAQLSSVTTPLSHRSHVSPRKLNHQPLF